jgi:pilus assembly protein CpaB
VAVVLGLVAAKLAGDMIARNRGNGNSNTKMTRVVVAKESISPGQELKAENLTTTQVAGDGIPGTKPAAADWAGRVAMAQIDKGQPVLEALLTPLGNGSGLQALVPDGMRAITIEVNEFTGVAGLLVPGCRVDLISLLHNTETNEDVSRTIVENLKVSAVGQRMGVSKEADEQNKGFRSVTLIASPVEAETIQLAASTGRPWLSLRSSKDTLKVQGRGVTAAQLMHNTNAGGDPFIFAAHNSSTQPSTQPSRATAETMRVRSVKVIKAGQETTVTFEMPRSAMSSVGQD